MNSLGLSKMSKQLSQPQYTSDYILKMFLWFPVLTCNVSVSMLLYHNNT